jgi:hypothetical protein
MEKFKLPRDMWLRFGCFLSGHNFQILSECSEASKRDQKKITSALVIITLIWSIIGFIFSQKYLNFGFLGSIGGALFMAILIVQIERQIILTSKLGFWAKAFRVFLGVIVAIIGASIIDQYLFANDIKIIAQQSVEGKAAKESEVARLIYNKQIAQIDYSISNENNTLNDLSIKISKLPPTIDGGGGGYQKDPKTGKVISKQGKNRIPNPEITNLRNSEAATNLRKRSLEDEKIQKANEYSRAIKNKQTEILNRDSGFLEELNALIKYLFDFNPYPTALIFYLIWFFFFLLIESLVLIIKSTHTSNDYEKIIDYQQKIREQRLMILEDKRNAALGSDLNIDASNKLLNNTPK